MDENSEIELSREQHRAVVAVDVLRLVNPGERLTATLYRRAVAELERYLEFSVPDPDEGEDADDRRERFDP